MSKNKPETPLRYHHGDLRSALILAAERLLIDQGSWTFTLREVARAAGVSHNAPYNHFADKRALLDTLAIRAFDALRASLTAAIARAKDTDVATKIEAAAISYVLFAVDQPARFRLMFSAELSQSKSSDMDVATAAAFGELKMLITAGVANGELCGDPLDTHALSAWSLVHGLSSLILDRRTATNADRATMADLAGVVGRTLISGLEVRTCVRNRDASAPLSSAAD
jgi:AcrR family transcriptional regulator